MTTNKINDRDGIEGVELAGALGRNPTEPERITWLLGILRGNPDEVLEGVSKLITRASEWTANVLLRQARIDNLFEEMRRSNQSEMLKEPSAADKLIPPEQVEKMSDEEMQLWVDCRYKLLNRQELTIEEIEYACRHPDTLFIVIDDKRYSVQDLIEAQRQVDAPASAKMNITYSMDVIYAAMSVLMGLYS